MKDPPKRRKISGASSHASSSRPQKISRSDAKRSHLAGSTSMSAIYVSDGDDEDSDDYILLDPFPHLSDGKGKGKETRKGRKRKDAEVQIIPSSPPPTPPSRPQGRKGWKVDFEELKASCSSGYYADGHNGLPVFVDKIRSGDADDSISLRLSYNDVKNAQHAFTIQIVFDALTDYPSFYNTLIFADEEVPPRALGTFELFTNVFRLNLTELIQKIVHSLQGDDTANGGEPEDVDPEEPPLFSLEEEDRYDFIGRGFETAHGSKLDLGDKWGVLKEHFEQIKQFGYRPGFDQVSDFWAVTISIPFKDMSIEPKTLAMWDDGLVEAWRNDQRFTLIVQCYSYPPREDTVKYCLGLGDHYKPSSQAILETTSGKPGGLKSFFPSGALQNYLKAFPRAMHVRCAFNLEWSACDRIGLDEEESRKVFKAGEIPKGEPNSGKDPVGRGFQGNLALCAFHWILRRFVHATQYCLNCGLQVEHASSRPYVCGSPLCVYGYMSLGLGPSLEHVIITQPTVVDLLLSFAYSAASSQTRMDLPRELNIELPKESEWGRRYLDDLDDATCRKAVAWLIESLPHVSEIKATLESGTKLAQIEAYPGAIGILRWVVASCRAYLKELRTGDGVLNDMQHSSGRYYSDFSSGSSQDSTTFRQFAFVVDSPEKEAAFAQEVQKSHGQRAADHPTMLVFHGSATERWHNILRTGLDFQETANARAYGHGVYFAHEASTSLSGYSRPTGACRKNADFFVTRAVAMVELVNVPSTFVSSNPYYVVNNVNQIKPFLLIVQGTDMLGSASQPGEPPPPPVIEELPDRELFKHDPKLKMPPTFYSQPLKVAMPEKLQPVRFVDREKDDEQDQKILSWTERPKTPPKVIKLFEPSPQSRLDRLQLMPPPSANSTVASKHLAREFKTLVTIQKEGNLPFHIDPENDSLYCWLLELHEFPESQLKEDMKKHNVRSIITEMRFPASYPNSPPFVRILHPRFLQFASGGGGHITAGGSICHELLTAQGWQPVLSIEGVVRDIMVNMTEATPPARLDPRSWDNPYTLQEAVEAFKRVAMTHGWEIPKDFDKAETILRPFVFLDR